MRLKLLSSYPEQRLTRLVAVSNVVLMILLIRVILLHLITTFVDLRFCDLYLALVKMPILLSSTFHTFVFTVCTSIRQ